MTDQEIEQLAKERFSHGVGIIQFIMDYPFVISDRVAFIEGAKAIRDRSIPIKHYKASPDDIFDIDCDVTGCCGVGPITSENYCPNCGCKIERETVL